MFCNECGKQVPNKAKFCQECGAAQVTLELEKVVTKPDPLVTKPEELVTEPDLDVILKKEMTDWRDDTGNESNETEPVTEGGASWNRYNPEQLKSATDGINYSAFLVALATMAFIVGIVYSVLLGLGVKMPAILGSEENTSTEATNNIKSDVVKVDDRIYKLDDMSISLKFLSNPFDVRKRLIGKNIETKMFVVKFIDEGTNARLVGDGSGLTCVMDGTEYGQHNDRGVKVVRGILVEWGGGIALDNCKYISNDNRWQATDKLENIN